MTEMEGSELSNQDVNTLIDALDVWERDSFGASMGSLVGEMLMKDAPPEARAKFKAEEDVRKKKEADAQRVRRERSIMLKAKLLKMRDSMAADELLSA